jgi:type I restriction enzyme, R subunit
MGDRAIAEAEVEIAAELVHELDADGKQLRVVKLTDYTAEKVRTLCDSPDELRARWADGNRRDACPTQDCPQSVRFQFHGWLNPACKQSVSG